MTTAIQNLNQTATSAFPPAIPTNGNAEAISDNITRIFKKMLPFPANLRKPSIIISVDMGEASWHVGILTGASHSHKRLEGGDKRRLLLSEIAGAMARHGVVSREDVMACYEVGRNGVWPREFLVMNGIPCVVLSPDVIAAPGRTPKSDRLDARRLGERLARFYNGELSCDKVYMPVPEEIRDARVSERLREELVKDRTRYAGRFKSLLALHTEVPAGLDIGRAAPSALLDCLGRPLPPGVVDALEFLRSQWLALDGKVKALEKAGEQADRAVVREMKAGRPVPEDDRRRVELMRLKGVGHTTARVLSRELLWKDFRSARQVGSATGLVDVPYSSGRVSKSAGISRRASGRIRGTLVEFAWTWVRRQPYSDITQWFMRRTMTGTVRSAKKAAIVAVARRLAVALWRWVEKGQAPCGAILKAL